MKWCPTWDDYKGVLDSISAVALSIGGEMSVPRRIVLACFDESGKFKDSDVVAFGGCVFVPQTLQRFSHEWKARLEVDGLPFTSMKDAVHCKGPYEKFWKVAEDKRDAILIDLATMLVDASAIRIVSSMLTSTFNAFNQQFREKMGNDPVYAGFESSLMGILHSSPTIEVHVVYDLSEEYSEKAIKLFHKLRRNKADFKERCNGISFADDELHAGLQAADMIAFCARAQTERHKKQPRPIVDRLIGILKTEDSVEMTTLYKIAGEGLGDAELKP
jgi:Protein of unknown function (DUF3800)